MSNSSEARSLHVHNAQPTAALSREAEGTAVQRSRPDRPTVSVIVPAMNEAKNLPFVLPFIPDWVDEVVLVDGHSKDDTVAVARALLPHIRVVVQPGKGKGDALRAGFSAATGDIIVMIDSDGSTDPREIGSFVRQLRSGAEFVKGSRYMQGAGSNDISHIRSWGNSGITWAVRVLFGGRYSDLCYGYAAFWRVLLPVLDLDSDGFEIETLMGIRALKAKLRIFEVHSMEHARIHGSSNLNAVRDGWRIFKLILRERFLRGSPNRRRVEQVRQSLARFWDGPFARGVSTH
ncbi:glycosyltransferase family 2 protein [Deinococcus hopiensis]|uniref:Glycosyltransferase involved in cell wall bisynthesis n=1 Tax=Deinococcus hopiensis KR-140 TaxID=695939 RepID=A0A1W1UFK0_9DEIO|nr:glycosyltransferase family 2 protein [Deinococcus hopiensis]SMB79875.1 Glycosyltransferase involved in cell wall bisynthesis [Deinococcus hopiensis KR-140]